MALRKGAAISFSNKQKSTPKAPPNQNLSALTKPSPQFCTHNTSLKPMATLSNKTFYSKTINLQFILKSTDHSPAPNAPNTSNIATSSLAIKLPIVILRFYISLLKLFGLMFSTKPQQGGPFCLDRSDLVNVPINCDNNTKCFKISPLLLPSDKYPQNALAE